MREINGYLIVPRGGNKDVGLGAPADAGNPIGDSPNDAIIVWVFTSTHHSGYSKSGTTRRSNTIIVVLAGPREDLPLLARNPIFHECSGSSGFRKRLALIHFSFPFVPDGCSRQNGVVFRWGAQEEERGQEVLRLE
jgi:hypothetical protein